MKQEEKELLLQDLSARLPYGVIVETTKGKGHVCDINLTIFGDKIGVNINPTSRDIFDIEECKPYLFPLSSMTEEQWNNAPRVNLTNFTFESLKCGCFTLASYTCENDLHDLITFVNWLIKNHFDVNNLISMGLATNATNLNIY